MIKKWIAIGISIVSMVILIFTSLTNVVGYQSERSITVNDSPLFKTRTERTTNQQRNILMSQYLGIEKENLLQFPIRDNRTEQLRKALDIISKMDDTTFARFTEVCIRNIKQSNALRGITINDLLQILSQLRTKSDIRNDFSEDDPPSIFYFSLCGWGPGCILHLFIAGVIAIVVVLVFMLVGILHPTENMACRSVQIC